MFLNATDLGQAGPAGYDLCIVGAGAAGLSMVQRLAGRGLKIALIESGGAVGREAAPDAGADALNAGVSALADYPFQASRARGFGGTTALWTGACLRLSAEDFEPRDWVPHSGWPIGADDLEPYYRAAEPLFGMVDPAAHFEAVTSSPLHGGGLEADYAQLTRQPHFGENHRDLVARAQDVDCILGGTVVGMEADGGRVTCVLLRDAGGAEHQVAARATVLACGGIEVPRLLLMAPDALKVAMGPSADLVGRYHMEHPIRSLGVIKVPDARSRVVGFTDITRTEGADLQGIFGVSEDVRRDERLLNLHCRAYRFHALENDPVIVRLKGAAMGGGLGGLRPAAALKSARYVAWHYWNKLSRRASFDHIRLLAFLEQEPDPENRITLSDQVDRHGLPLPHLHLTESGLMTDSLSRTLEIMGQALDARGLPDHDLGEAAHLAHYGGYGLHHMGGTRMSSDPHKGVVDADCCVHGVDNLYVASSSVFATGGAANPTLTISALSLRLADHLRQILFSR